MTLQKKYIEDKDGNQVLPITHQSAVKDSDGNTLEDVLWEEKEYDPTHYSGMGKVVLNKNMVSGVNTITQSMINQVNTIYLNFTSSNVSGVMTPEKAELDAATAGIEIIHKGNDVWVDALGRVVQ